MCVAVSRDFTRPDLPTGEPEQPALPDLTAYGQEERKYTCAFVFNRGFVCL